MPEVRYYNPRHKKFRCCCASPATVGIQAFRIDATGGQSLIEVTRIASPVVGASIRRIRIPNGRILWEGESDNLTSSNFPNISSMYSSSASSNRQDFEINADVMPVIYLRSSNTGGAQYCHRTTATILGFGSMPWVCGCFSRSYYNQCDSYSSYRTSAGYNMEIADSAKPQKNTFALLGDPSLNYMVLNPNRPDDIPWDFYKFKSCTSIGSSITNLMSSAVNTSDFSYAFEYMSGEGNSPRRSEIVPDMFVGCVNAEDFSFCFQGGSGSAKRNPSVYIPNNIFRGCEKARKFGSCFALSDCYAFHDNGRGAIPDDLFEGTAADDFSHCFSRNPVQPPLPLMSAPPLWERFPNANGTGCFYGWGDSRYSDGTFTKLDATWNCPNWFDIPYEWSFP